MIAALFEGVAGACDVNRDGRLTAADVTARILALPAPRSTQTATATVFTSNEPTSTLTSSPRASPTATRTARRTPTPTGTPRPCPIVGADVVIEVDNQTGQPAVTAVFSGERLTDDCVAGSLPTTYNVTAECDGVGVVPCAELRGLAPGWWHHSISVAALDTKQVQHQAALLVSGNPSNRAHFTAFASIVTVRTRKNTGTGSLRQALQSVAAMSKPLLIQFDPRVFPDGVPTTISLRSPLPALATDDVTIDGVDATGAAGNRIIDARGLAIPALAITGARNHIVGLHLRNTGNNNRDTLSITGAAADGNVVERAIIENSASADAVGIDHDAGKDFGDTANVIRDCEIRGAADKGVKVTVGAYARVERCWVHDNANGGVQATLGGHLQTQHNLVEHNRGSSAQNGLSVNASDDSVVSTVVSELHSWGDISRGNGANGLSVRAALAEVRDAYLASNTTSGIRVFNDVGDPASAVVEGTSAVCNGVDGGVVANTSRADFGGGALGSHGNNAFAQNNLPAGGSNLRNATATTVDAINAQWEHCGPGTTCNNAAIADFDLSDHAANTVFLPSQAHRSQQPPELAGVAPSKGRQGDLLRIFGSGFNVIDGHFSETMCADVSGRNRCVPLRGNCVRIDGVPAPVEAVTPTMLVVRWPLTCVEPVPLVVITDQGSTGATSAPFTVCVNETPAPMLTPTAMASASVTESATLTPTQTPTETPAVSPGGKVSALPTPPFTAAAGR